MDDTAKELAIRQAAFALLAGSVDLAWRLAATFLAAAVPIYVAHWMNWSSLHETLDVLLGLNFLIGATVLAIVLVWVVRPKPSRTAHSETYNAADRFLHALAFSGPGMLRGVARLDDRLFAATLLKTQSPRSVFITSLARGGTTAVLNALDAVPQTVTYHYRDMPFITAPLMWSKMTSLRGRSIMPVERAHGDGLSIDLNTPEAFDEVLWRLFWPEKYTANQIALWTHEDLKPEATQFFKTQLKKLAHVQTSSVADACYLSKNNANLARLPLLHEMFPDAHIVVPLRRPAPHAASLLRQHRNFLDLHERNPFAKRYMRDIGHLEFGALHTPIGFPGFDAAARDPLHPDYWINYWHAAFSWLLEQDIPYRLIVQDNLRCDAEQTMQELCKDLGLYGGQIAFAPFFRTKPDRDPQDTFSPDALGKANDVYQRLIRKQMNEGLG
ncbi:MAG: sulfotransferase [Pseudomonadota bacterium]